MIEEFLKIPNYFQNDQLSTTNETLIDWYNQSLSNNSFVSIPPAPNLSPNSTTTSTLKLSEQENESKNPNNIEKQQTTIETNNKYQIENPKITDSNEKIEASEQIESNQEFPDQKQPYNILTYDLSNSNNICNDLYRFERFSTKKSHIPKLLMKQDEVVLKFKLSQYFHLLNDHLVDKDELDLLTCDAIKSFENAVFSFKIFFINELICRNVYINKKKLNNEFKTDGNDIDAEYDKLVEEIKNKIKYIRISKKLRRNRLKKMKLTDFMKVMPI